MCHVDSLLDTTIVSHLRVSTESGQLQLHFSIFLPIYMEDGLSNNVILVASQ